METATQAGKKSPEGRMAGKVAVVTGGRGDLGSATARLLADHGATVASLDRAGTPAVGVHPRITEYDVDVTDESSVMETIRTLEAKHGSTDVLVNAAGIIGPAGASHTATVDDFNVIFDVNVKGVWLMTKHIVPGMIRQESGSIINFSSIHGLTGGRNVPLYHATKGAVRLLSKSDAAAYGAHGIRVNSIHPGSMNTRMSRRSAEQSDIGAEAYYKQLVGGNPLPRQGEPDEIAYGVLYLASDESRFTTGSELVIDGGYTAV
ncbi:SDR family NAD(P)-dependent oxidoreductase [Paenarthrobacter aurescens]|uniref:SDR family NAD(P)-dependent oxidoreductase n=1 Tax=Paenarthrobacter aurescens TaxID=43663 RepID=UPI001FE5D20B|nr:SDR family oxidoreductase [Paenarthrobacter aurescens]MDO6143494.1 SDR family oxidoreductase [Paenarthrobacter aurescens]MDO6147342.1 SDR family oxidoreductase [Paenarthrobacter aurescens]MDO6158586.1 SDR family oxidoreductase [Paenarthrobacter aurescens]MDO6162569.1 SDR family oxidoreductase [Paenarthrobacter aurescens]